MFNWAALDFTGLANAFLALITSVIVVVAVKLGRKAKEPPAAIGAMKMDGIAIVSAGPIQGLTAAIEAATLEAMTSRLTAEENRKKLEQAGEKARQIGYDAIALADKFKDEIKDLRDEVRRLGDVARR